MWTKKDMPDQSGKTFIVTGANAGIGYETAKALYESNAIVVLACRDLKKAQNAAEILTKSGGKGKLEIAELNLEDLSSVKIFA
jgi:NAD(P)-dependent dehydrogenase (short-subunit alcohol dehydrogenase family)